MRIWKFDLTLDARQEIELPDGAQFLTAQQVRGYVLLWALVDEKAATVTRTIATYYGKGSQLPDNPGAYIATVQTHGGALVYHFFEYFENP